MIDHASLIAEVNRIVETACKADSNIFGYGIWTHHITEVARNGKYLAPMFGANPEIVELAALLHDYASVKDETLYEDHHIYGPIEAEKILLNLNYPAERIEAVKHAIEAHRASVEIEGRSAEARCLRNADAMAHIQNLPSLLHLAYVQRGMGIMEGAAWVRAKLARSWKKLDPVVQAMVKDQYEAAKKLLPEGAV